MSEPRSWWSVLVDVLGSLGDVAGSEPVGLVVSTRRGDVTRRRIEVVMTEDEWDDMVSIMWGEVEGAAQHVRQLVLQQPRDKRYLVYSQYMLEPCVDPVLPVGPVIASFLWLDRYEPEPVRLLVTAFFWGAVVATAAALVLQALDQFVLGTPDDWSVNRRTVPVATSTPKTSSCDVGSVPSIVHAKKRISPVGLPP